jgi:hypothetical protein
MKFFLFLSPPPLSGHLASEFRRPDWSRRDEIVSARTSIANITSARRFVFDSVNKNIHPYTHVYVYVLIMVNNTPEHNGELSASIVSRKIINLAVEQ